MIPRTSCKNTLNVVNTMYVQDRGMREAQPIVCSWAGMENQKSGRTEPVRPTTMTASVKRKLIINLKDKKCQNVKSSSMVMIN